MGMDVICLFDENGYSARMWAENGYDVYCYDIKHNQERIEIVGEGRIIFRHWDAMDESQNQKIIDSHNGAFMGLAFPPCTDLAVSGAAHFAKKKLADPLFQVKAMCMVMSAVKIFNTLKVRYAVENPVSVISTMWRKPDYIFHPYEYGGYLPENDVHPLWPDYILPRDAYPKKTCYWTGNGFVMPIKKPVAVNPGYSIQHKKLGGKSAKTKSIRSLSPRGIGIGTYEANKPKPTRKAIGE